MANSKLRRCVWLTENQRKRLSIAADHCHKENPSSSLTELIAELQDLSARKVSFPTDVQTIIKGLRLPSDILPVSLCDDTADTLIVSDMLDPELICLIKPLPRKEI